MFKTLHFETGHYTAHPIFLGDEEYSRALDCLVKACTDLIVVSEETDKILLGKRKVEPQPDWYEEILEWCDRQIVLEIAMVCRSPSRMKPGERVEESAARLFKRELGINIPKDQALLRFRSVGHYSFLWEKRAQAPQENGTADISIVLTIKLTKQEIDSIVMDQQEYGDTMWIDADVVVAQSHPSIQFHPALRRAVQDLLAMRKWLQIEEVMKVDSTSDATVHNLLKEFMQLKKV